MPYFNFRGSKVSEYNEDLSAIRESSRKQEHCLEDIRSVLDKERISNSLNQLFLIITTISAVIIAFKI